MHRRGFYDAWTPRQDDFPFRLWLLVLSRADVSLEATSCSIRFRAQVISCKITPLQSRASVALHEVMQQLLRRISAIEAPEFEPGQPPSEFR